ncbi:MAG: acyl-CoA thioesterase [Lysobacterales bacterium]
MPRRSDVTLRFLAEPSDVNFGGKVHGGMVMKWIDQAGWAAAVGWSGRYSVTVYVGGIRFLAPILIGNVVEVGARIIHTGNTSMHLAVDVWASDSMAETRVRTTHCVIVFVALDEEGKPVAVPKWLPQTDEQRSFSEYAQRLMQLREGIETEMQAFIQSPPDA